MTRVRVDFNSRGADGTIRGSQRRADGPLEVDAAVELYDPAEPDMNFEATVATFDAATGRALFAVRWEPAASPRRVGLGARFAKATSWGMPQPPLEVPVPMPSPQPVGARFA